MFSFAPNVSPMKYILALLLMLTFLLIKANTLTRFLPFHDDFLENKTKQKDSLIFQIYPNPLKDNRLFVISSGSGEKHIEIYNVFGEKVIEIFTYEKSLLLDRLTSGIYLFQLHQDNQRGLELLVVP